MWMFLIIFLALVNVIILLSELTTYIRHNFFTVLSVPSLLLLWNLPNSLFLHSSPSVPKVQRHGTSVYCSDLLDDGGSVALLVVGFLLLAPLLVLALAAYCRMARHLQLGLCFIPYSRAVYKNLPASRHRGLGGCCDQQGAGESEGKGSVWVWAAKKKERGEFNVNSHSKRSHTQNQLVPICQYMQCHVLSSFTNCAFIQHQNLFTCNFVVTVLFGPF